MKNVLVFYSHNLSGGYLSDMQLSDPIGLAPNFDSGELIQWIESPNESEALKEYANEMLAQLQSKDGIQFHHIKHKYPRYDATQPITENNLEYWVDQMQEYIAKRGENLDAIVLPVGEEASYPSTFRWLREMRTRFPEVKIIVENSYMPYKAPDEPRIRESYVEPTSPEYQITNGIRKVIIKDGTDGYKLNTDVADVVTKNIHGTDSANALRDMLGMEPLKAPERGRR